MSKPIRNYNKKDMSIDQRTILEIILGLYKIENQYIDQIPTG
jgi:hypothetical protein